MQLADKNEEQLQESSDQSTAHPGKATEQIDSLPVNEGQRTLLDEEDLKAITLTNEEVEAVIRPDTAVHTPSGSSGPEEKDITG